MDDARGRVLDGQVFWLDWWICAIHGRGCLRTKRKQKQPTCVINRMRAMLLRRLTWSGVARLAVGSDRSPGRSRMTAGLKCPCVRAQRDGGRAPLVDTPAQRDGWNGEDHKRP